MKQTLSYIFFGLIFLVSGFAVGRMTRPYRITEDERVRFTASVNEDTARMWYGADTLTHIVDSNDIEVIKAMNRRWDFYSASCKTGPYLITFVRGQDTAVEVICNGSRVEVSPGVERWIITKLGR